MGDGMARAFRESELIHRLLKKSFKVKIVILSNAKNLALSAQDKLREESCISSNTRSSAEYTPCERFFSREVYPEKLRDPSFHSELALSLSKR